MDLEQEEALQAIVTEWLKVPEEGRTEESASLFALRMMAWHLELTSFHTDGDKFELIKDALCQHLGSQ